MPFYGWLPAEWPGLPTAVAENRPRYHPVLSAYVKGRRLRTLMRLLPWVPVEVTPEQYMVAAEQLRAFADPYKALPFRVRGLLGADAITEPRPHPTSSDPELHEALRDLAYEVLEDIQEACAAFDDPDVWYAGVDEGIDPVSDDHVRLVMWAMQRELDRETRLSRADPMTRLGAVQLTSLPWRVQRALAERRRLRYAQWGIGEKQWRENSWSLWDVPIDPGYQSRREQRGLAEQNDARVKPLGLPYDG